MSTLIDSGAAVELRERASVLLAVRNRRGNIAVLLALAAVAWWSTAVRMAGMDAGPGTDLGELGWFTTTWAVMMAAMMLPALAPTAAALVTLTDRHRARGGLLFAGGYLLVWTVAGIGADALFQVGKRLLESPLAWSNGGRAAAAAVLALAAFYQLTPFKQRCLTRCVSPWRYVAPSCRDRDSGALVAGVRAGGWCVGCSWALMAALFALGVMSLTWMAVIAVLVLIEKLAPWRRAAMIATAMILLGLGVGVAAAPHSVPGLTIPRHAAGGHAMRMVS
jgi:predicted metal-binding membrane protein